MKYIRQRALAGEFLAGGWCNLGSTITAEMTGRAGFDWLLIDLEHGSADFETLVHQLQAVESTPAVPIVRIAWNDPPRYKRVLDAGASGVMVPYVSTEEEAKLAAASVRYPPAGIRGVAKLNRGSRFGETFDEYFSTANDNLLTVVQIETEQAVANADAIAAVEGIDVLFIGPLDLSVNLGVPQQFNHATFNRALDTVVAACRKRGKVPGILLGLPEQVEQRVEQGFKFIALGSDGGLVAAGVKKNSQALAKHR